ncbi:MAG TPA: nucleotidyltransferase family protein [Tepidisphaeraceae bacterium]|jgi:molybdenum cofactor cytidylyltransferase|nr:nucleotidyltransferase family protein [Tepidisphaeraceae bacterium]
MICAIVLAAGRSRRMGTQKLLLPFAGKTVIAHIVDQLLASKVGHVLVIVGAEAEAVGAALGGRQITLVRNPDPDAEMLSSVRCGFASLPNDCAAALIALGDQPSITPDIVDQLIERFLTGSHGIVVPFHDGHRGHPMIVSARYRDEIMDQHDDSGLRGLLDAHAAEVFKLPSGDSVLEDMDYPEDYRRALARFSPL